MMMMRGRPWLAAIMGVAALAGGLLLLLTPPLA